METPELLWETHFPALTVLFFFFLLFCLLLPVLSAHTSWKSLSIPCKVFISVESITLSILRTVFRTVTALSAFPHTQYSRAFAGQSCLLVHVFVTVKCSQEDPTLQVWTHEYFCFFFLTQTKEKKKKHQQLVLWSYFQCSGF